MAFKATLQQPLRRNSRVDGKTVAIRAWLDARLGILSRDPKEEIFSILKDEVIQVLVLEARLPLFYFF